MFFDLNIVYDRADTSNLAETLVTAIRYGYGCVALNLTTSNLTKDDISVIETLDLEGALSSQQAGSGASKLSKALEKVDPALIKEAVARLEASGKKFQQLKRVTIEMSQDSQIQSISANNSLLNSFDIVAAQPTTEKLFLAAVQSTEIDIITFDATKRLNFRIKTATARQAVDNGIMFEICFKDTLRDPQARKNAFANAKRIIEATKGKNVVISSGAKESILLRAPYDLINLSHVFGLEASVARRALSQNPRALLLHALTRKTHRGVVDIQLIADLEDHLKWTVPEQVQLGQYDLGDSAMDEDDGESGDEEEEKGAPALASSSSMEVDTPTPHTTSKSSEKAASSIAPLPSKQNKGKRKREE